MVRGAVVGDCGGECVRYCGGLLDGGAVDYQRIGRLVEVVVGLPLMRRIILHMF